MIFKPYRNKSFISAKSFLSLYGVSALCDYSQSKSISTLLITVMGVRLRLPLLQLC